METEDISTKNWLFLFELKVEDYLMHFPVYTPSQYTVPNPLVVILPSYMSKKLFVKTKNPEKKTIREIKDYHINNSYLFTKENDK